MPSVADGALPSLEWPYLQALQRLALALALGLFVGLERQRHGKEAGLRTFAFATLLGCLGGLLGVEFSLLSLALIGVLVVLLNIHAIVSGHPVELTTSAAMLVMGFVGVLCGHGHTFVPAAVGVLSAALLAWKQPLAGFSLGLTQAELRSAILLAILAFVIYPALPEGSIDPWGLLEVRTAWVTVILIAGIGFGNYVLLKVYARGAVELTGFLGGLVNSTVTVTALAARVREQHGLVAAAYRGILLATAAMLIRNAVLLAILAPQAALSAVPALVCMLATSVCLLLAGRGPPSDYVPGAAGLGLQSPFSLASALKFGVLFLALRVAGILAQRWFGYLGFYGVSVAGGLVSSASAVASAGSLAQQGVVSNTVAGTGAILASLMSTLVDLPLVARIAREHALTRRLGWALVLVAVMGLLGVLAGAWLL
jgi:uncharacterized membrane protein (DUF4010 family)